MLTGFAVPVHVVDSNHDPFDWIVLGIAVVGAAVAVWVWWCGFRSHPEVAFEWRWPGNRAREWDPDDVLKVDAGVPYHVHIELYNVGTGSATPLVTNFVVPSWVQIEETQGRVQRDGEEVAVGNWPTHECHWMAQNISAFFPALPVRLEFTFMIVPRLVPAEFAAGKKFYVGASVEGDRFNASGRLRGRSIAHRWPDPGLWKQEEWPGKGSRRVLRHVQAEPHGKLRIGQGKRLDRRPVAIRA